MAGDQTSITRYIGSMINNTKDLVDGMLDRANDVESDVRGTLGDNVRENGGSAAGGNDPEDLAQLRQSLAALTEKVDQLAESQAKK